MKCPVCKYENSATAKRCYCGYEFPPQQASAPSVAPSLPRDHPPSQPNIPPPRGSPENKKRRNNINYEKIGEVIGGVIALIFFAWLLVSHYLPNRSSSASFSSEGGREPDNSITAPKLELQAVHWELDDHFVRVEGAVKNISQKSLKYVEAVAIFKDSNGTFVKSEDGYAEYDPILPGQISPFKVIGTANPAMKSMSIDFKDGEGGGTIPVTSASDRGALPATPIVVGNVSGSNAPTVAEIPTTVEEAEQFVQGPWTYSGQDFKLIGQTIWLKVVFKPDHTADVCWQRPTANSWDDDPVNHDNVPYVIASNKYSNTGERYFAIGFGKSGGVSAGVNDDGTIFYKTSIGGGDVNLTRGDAKPFSK